MAALAESATMQVLGVVGPSGAGKTTLIERLVGHLAVDRTVATVKSIHHDIAVDEPGTDTHRHRAAGAVATVGITPGRTFGFAERGKRAADEEAASLEAVLDGFADRGVDVALVEGFGDATIPKVAVGADDRVAAEPVVDAVDDGQVDLAPLDETLDGLRAYETAGSVVQRVGGDVACRAVASATVESGVEPSAWTHRRIEAPRPLLDAGLDALPGAGPETVFVRPPVAAGGAAVVHVAVATSARERGFAAVASAGDRLRAALDPARVETIVREG